MTSDDSATDRRPGRGVRLVVGDEVRARFPAYRALVVEAFGVRNGPSDDDSIASSRK